MDELGAAAAVTKLSTGGYQRGRGCRTGRKAFAAVSGAQERAPQMNVAVVPQIHDAKIGALTALPFPNEIGRDPVPQPGGSPYSASAGRCKPLDRFPLEVLPDLEIGQRGER